MGCAQSSHPKKPTDYSRRNTLVLKPQVRMRAGEGIQSINDMNSTQVIFIFGGPGSGKGTIVNNLVDMYNFRFICGEDLILEKLSKRLLPECPRNGWVCTEATQRLQKTMSIDSSMLTLHWVLELIEAEIAKYPGQTVLVDIMPNLKFLLRVPTFVKNCQEEMELFEKNHPVLFSLNLALDQDFLVSNLQQTHACVQAPKSGQNAEDKASSDELDTSRTQRRFNVYHNSVKDFLGYFERDRKLLSVDTSCGNLEAVWETIRDYIIDSDFAHPSQGIEQVVLMKMCSGDFENIDRLRYPMLDIDCKELLPDYNTAPPDKILKKIWLQLRLNAVDWKTFLVDCSDTSLCDQESFSRYTYKSGLLFMEVEMGQLDYFMHNLRRKTDRKKSLARKEAQTYISISSSENETLLFPSYMDRVFCQRIGVEFLNAR